MSVDSLEDRAESRSIAFEYELDEPVEKVWRALTAPEIVAEWLLPNDLEPEEGTRFTFRDTDGPIDCEVISIEEQRSIRFAWRDGEARRDGLDSTVTFEVEGTTNGGTHLRIIHEVRYATQLARPPVTACLAANDNGATGLQMAA
jgi:uncharacterized protein YndB with AHSA1/START domain